MILTYSINLIPLGWKEAFQRNVKIKSVEQCLKMSLL